VKTSPATNSPGHAESVLLLSEATLSSDALKYTRVAMLLHWAIALFILANIALGLSAALLPTSILSDVNARVVIDLHKSIGITVLGLAILRVLWRLTHRPPPLPDVFLSWEKTTAHLAHVALYVLIFALPLSGWAHDSAWSAAASHPMHLFGLVPWPRMGFLMHLDPALKDRMHTQLGTLHTWCGYALYVVLTLHIVGALKHQWIDRHPVLGRMLP
jgi:cytochrome b561